MKIWHILLLLVFPVITEAELEAVVYPLSPYIEIGQTNTFLISITNHGTNDVPIPKGKFDTDGRIIPCGDFSPSGDVYQLINGAPKRSGVCGQVGFKIGSFKEFSLAPEETATYKYSWVINFSDDVLAALNIESMFLIKFECDEMDIEIPSISLYLKPKSNKSTHSITGSAGSE